ncbi:Nucleotidyltransferase [Sarocladium strictum]
MTLDFPPIFLLPAHLQPEQLLELEEQIPSLTYDIHEAEVILGSVSKPERARFELRRAKLDTEPVEYRIVDQDGDGDEPSHKRRKLDAEESGKKSPDTEKRNTVKVLRLQWLNDSLEKGQVLPFDRYLVYEGAIREPPKESQTSPTTQSISERAAVASAPVSPKSSRQYGPDRHKKLSQPHRPSLLHETTSDHDVRLPPIPEFLHTTYSCQRPTFVNPPNSDFVEELKKVRTLRLLQGDQIGVRAYSTSIATLAAYPYTLQNVAEVARLPGCGSKIAVLWEQFKETGTLQEVQEAAQDEKLSVLQVFYDIWGVGDTTAREFYKKGWRDQDDLTEFAWGSLSRVQQIGLKYYDELLLKIPRSEVEAIAATIHSSARDLDPGYQMIIVGGYRRGKDQSGDVDVILSHPSEEKTNMLVKKIALRLEKSGHIKWVLSLSTKNSERGQRPLAWRGEGSRGSGFDTLDKALVVWKDPDNAAAPHRRVDIIVSPWRTVGCAVLGWSGGTTFQRDLRRYCKKEKNLKFDSSGIRSRADGAWIDFENGDSETRATDMEEAERRVFQGLDLEYRPPEERCTG